MQNFNKLLHKGFTLIEIIVVITILGIISSLGFNLLSPNDVKEDIDIEGVKIQSFLESIQFNSIVGRGFKDGSGDWILPDERKVTFLLEDSSWLGESVPGVANVKSYYNEDGIETLHETLISKDGYGTNPVTINIICHDLEGNTTNLDLEKKIDVTFKGVYIKSIISDSDEACLDAPKSVEFKVGKARSKFKYTFIVDRIPGTIYSKRGL